MDHHTHRLRVKDKLRELIRQLVGTWEGGINIAVPLDDDSAIKVPQNTVQHCRLVGFAYAPDPKAPPIQLQFILPWPSNAWVQNQVIGPELFGETTELKVMARCHISENSTETISGTASLGPTNSLIKWGNFSDEWRKKRQTESGIQQPPMTTSRGGRGEHAFSSSRKPMQVIRNGQLLDVSHERKEDATAGHGTAIAVLAQPRLIWPNDKP